MTRYLRPRDLDWTLLVISLVICGVGVLQIYSATRGTVWQDAWWKQIVYIAAGLVLMWLTVAIDYHTMMNHVFPVRFIRGGPARRSVDRQAGLRLAALDPGGGRLSFAGVGIRETGDNIVSSPLPDGVENRRSGRPRHGQNRGAGAVPMALVMKQPDLGTALTYVPHPDRRDVSGRHAPEVFDRHRRSGLAGASGWLDCFEGLSESAIGQFLDPDRDPRGTGYQLIQSKIAVGAGGMWGKGVTKGSQTQLRFLPVPHTDFIFSAFAEEHGFVGVIVVLALYFVLIMQIVQNAQTASDKAGMYICMGVAALLLFHVLVNVGMVVGRMPVTGIPLPLMSAGGSSVLSNFMMLGLVNNVRLRRFVN
jgi:rod shape determining protein RodA